MADDHTQRPYRSNEAPARGQPAKVPGMALPSNSGSDPLAELARLIGQNDPFSEFGRNGGREPAVPRLPEQAPEWAAQPAVAGYAPQMIAPDARAPRTPGAEHYQVEHNVPGYPAEQGAGFAAGYEADPYNQNNAQLAAEEEGFYDDEPPARRRLGVMVIAGVFALAVIGAAGVFGYRALFGTPGTSSPPPVIKAESGQSKIVPASTKDPQSNKLITDRVNDRGQGEKLVSREEQPVDIKDKPAGFGSPQGQDPSQSSTPPLGSGIVGSEPKRVRTIAIHPDQAAMADATPASAPPRVRAIAPDKPAAPAQPPRVVSNLPPAGDPEPAPPPRQAVVRVAPPVQQAAAPAPSNAPLSLSPDAPARTAPARAAAPATRTAAVATPAPIAPAAASGGNAGAGGYAVQVSSQRSEAEAQAAFRSLQGKYPSQLGGKQPLIHRVDLGEKGIYFRAMIGPFASGSEASELCGSLKAAGGQCIVQRN
jgi:hypothetical protein